MRTIYVNIRLAVTQDLLIAAGVFKLGTIYYIKHPKTHIVSGPYVLDKYHNSKKLEAYYHAKCIYVPVIDFDFDIANNLQQKDLKHQIETSSLTEKHVEN